MLMLIEKLTFYVLARSSIAETTCQIVNAHQSGHLIIR